ncbi:MAG: AraC family transcriptional regulator [Roseibacillus sp.]
MRECSQRKDHSGTWTPGLRGAKKSGSEVASECGYGDANYFCAVFREKGGMTPSQFRKRH